MVQTKIKACEKSVGKQVQIKLDKVYNPEY